MKASRFAAIAASVAAIGLAGSALAQNPDLIENTKNTMQAVQKKKEMDSNAALAAAQHTGTQATPSTGSPASLSSSTTLPSPSFSTSSTSIRLRPSSIFTFNSTSRSRSMLDACAS